MQTFVKNPQQSQHHNFTLSELNVKFFIKVYQLKYHGSIVYVYIFDK